MTDKDTNIIIDLINNCFEEYVSKIKLSIFDSKINMQNPTYPKNGKPMPKRRVVNLTLFFIISWSLPKYL